jgi:hypothetical protein
MAESGLVIWLMGTNIIEEHGRLIVPERLKQHVPFKCCIYLPDYMVSELRIIILLKCSEHIYINAVRPKFWFGDRDYYCFDWAHPSTFHLKKETESSL